MEHCNCCGWPLNEEHDFNIHCAVANAANDQLEAEAREAMKLPTTPDMEAGFARAQEVVAETLAYMRFVRDLHP